MLISCANYYYILDMNNFLDIWFAIIFSLPTDFPFTLLIVSLKKLFSLMPFHLLILLPLPVLLISYAIISLQRPMAWDFLLCCLLGVLYFQVVNPFWAYFCIWCKIRIQFHFLLRVESSFPQALLLNWLFLQCIFGAIVKSSWPHMCRFVSGLSIWFHWSMYLFLCQYHAGLFSFIFFVGFILTYL